MTTADASNFCWRFVASGLKQSGIFLLFLCLLAVLTWVGVRTGLAGGFLPHLGFWVAGLISGPTVPMLVHLDITNQDLLVLSLALILPYWACLGVVAGLSAWKSAFFAAGREQTAPLSLALGHIRTVVVIAALLVGCISTLSWPSFAGSRHPPHFSILNNLRQLDGAKQQLALEKKLPADYVPTLAELEPYLRHFHAIGAERYVLNPIREDPYAVLDADWRIRRRGWQEGYTITNKTVFRLPPP